METLTDKPKQTQPEATSTSPAEDKPAQDQQSAAIEERMKIESRARSGANWFFWIAALSVINSIMAMSGNDWGFIVGLGITQFIDAVGAELDASVITFVLSTSAAGTFVVFGVLANKRNSWAYVIGMVLYSLDGLLFLAVGDMLSVGFHVFVLFWMFQGYRANRALAESSAPGRRTSEGLPVGQTKG